MFSKRVWILCRHVVRSHHVAGFLHWRESITVICRQWVEKMASVDLIYSGFLHLLLLCHPFSTFPPLPAITASSSQPFLAARQLWGRTSSFWSLPFLLSPPPLNPPSRPFNYTDSNSLFPVSPTLFKLSQTTIGTVFIKVFNPLSTLPKKLCPTSLSLKLLFFTAPTGLHIPHPSSKNSSFQLPSSNTQHYPKSFPVPLL